MAAFGELYLQHYGNSDLKFVAVNTNTTTETQAIMDFVRTHPNIALVLDYHNHGDCLFYWLGPEEAEPQ